jgi:hypothetical protein
MIQYTGWNLDGLFMASALRGLSGSMTAFLAGATFFAINSVNSEMRSTRLGIQEFLNGIAYANIMTVITAGNPSAICKLRTESVISSCVLSS